jgi:hypothetical protein
MGGISKQTINGKNYYYAIETKRVNGQPRIVSKKYLGKPSYSNVATRLSSKIHRATRATLDNKLHTLNGQCHLDDKQDITID